MGIIIKKHKFAIIILLILLCSILILNCTKSDKNKQEEENNKIKIGLSLDSLVIERWQRDRDTFIAKSKELGAEVIVQNANKDNEEQINQIKYLISQGIDVLVIVPHDANALSSIVNTAKKKGIKVISYDRLIRNADIDLYISFDNVKVGKLMTEGLVKIVPKGNYIIINGPKEDFNTFMVNEGMKNVLKSYIERGDIEIIKEIWAEGWREEEAFSAVEEAIAARYKIDGIIAGNDRLAEAAIQILSEHRLAGVTYVVGQDAALAGCQRVVEGSQLMTVYKPIPVLAQKAAQIAVGLAQGKKIEANNKIYNGEKEVPFQVEDPIPVNVENMMDTVVKDGFHRKEDIYLNIPSSKLPKQ